MTEIPATPEVEDTVDHLALANEFMQLKEQLDQIQNLKRASKERDLTPSEVELLAKEPAICRRGVDVTRILRRTNTGPAKVKEKKGRAPSKKALEKEEIDKLFNM